MLILSDCITLEEAKIIDEYIEKGGKVISSGTSALNSEMTDFALAKWNFSYDGAAPFAGSHAFLWRLSLR